MREELLRYRLCGWIFLVMNLALSLMVFFMVYWNRTFHHHEITTIALAAYTFTAFTMAIINMILSLLPTMVLRFNTPALRRLYRRNLERERAVSENGRNESAEEIDSPHTS